jgi:hypothetical protein
MSRYNYNKKDTVENSLDIDVFWLRKHGYLHGYKNGGITWTYRSGSKASISICTNISDEQKYLRFIYSSTDKATEQKVEYDYKVSIVTTTCEFGGVRYWFLCPLFKDGVGCNRRVAKLYLGTKYFGCRQCHNLTYDSCQSHNKRFDIIGKMFAYERKSEELYQQVSRKYYKGRPTRKYAKYLKYCQWLDDRGGAVIEELNRFIKR